MSSDPGDRSDPPSRLSRSLGLGGAVVVGVSAMVGTGVFAVWQPALQQSGSWLVVAIMIAAVVAALNATSTARLAARYPEAGGVYAYGRILLGRPAGVLAGTVFVVGKTASASAAALTIGLYLWPAHNKAVAVIAIAIALLVNLRGIVRSTRVAGVMVIAVFIALLLFAVVVGFANIPTGQVEAPETTALSVLAASAVIFVAFAGYARITVLGEEVRDPARVIPRAIALSFVIVLALYLVVAIAVLVSSQRGIAIGPAALADIARVVAGPWLVIVVSIAALLAAGAVLLSLIAGVGRTLFAMADRSDFPRTFAAVGTRSRIPVRAEIAAAITAAVLVVLGGLTLALSISAAMILTYYAVAHVAAIRLQRSAKTTWLTASTPYLGLLGCAALVAALVVTYLTLA